MPSCRASAQDISKSHSATFNCKTDHRLPRKIVIRGEPCTIFFDKSLRYFIIGPIRNKQEFADRPGRYDHVIDLPEIPAAGTTGTEAPGNPQSIEGVPHPPPTNAWTLFMQEKWQELRKANPSVSFGEVSTEASRQWKAMSDEKKHNYHETAWELTEQHKFEYGDHFSRPGKK